MLKHEDYTDEFCLICGEEKRVNRSIPTKLGSVLVSLCGNHCGMDREDILDVISDKL